MHAPLIDRSQVRGASSLLVYVSPPTKQALRSWAFREQKALSQLAREILEAAISREASRSRKAPA